jgi:hypothetical protein
METPSPSEPSASPAEAEPDAAGEAAAEAAEPVPAAAQPESSERSSARTSAHAQILLMTESPHFRSGRAKDRSLFFMQGQYNRFSRKLEVLFKKNILFF